MPNYNLFHTVTSQLRECSECELLYRQLNVAMEIRQVIRPCASCATADSKESGYSELKVCPILDGPWDLVQAGTSCIPNGSAAGLEF